MAADEEVELVAEEAVAEVRSPEGSEEVNEESEDEKETGKEQGWTQGRSLWQVRSGLRQCRTPSGIVSEARIPCLRWLDV